MGELIVFDWNELVWIDNRVERSFEGLGVVVKWVGENRIEVW